MGKTWQKRGKKVRNSYRLGQRNRKKDDFPGELADFPSRAFEHMVGQCRGKIAYRAYNDALEAKERFESKFGVEYSVYECPICNRWHLTTHPWQKF